MTMDSSLTLISAAVEKFACRYLPALLTLTVPLTATVLITLLSRNSFSEDVTFIARSVGLTVNKAVKATEKNFQLSISGNTEIIPSRVVRKCAEPRKQIEAPCTTDFSVEKLGDDNYYGFHLNGDHLYMLEDFTVTHNSGKSVAAELAFARINRPTLFITTRALLMYQMEAQLRTRPLAFPSLLLVTVNLALRVVQPSSACSRSRWCRRFKRVLKDRIQRQRACTFAETCYPKGNERTTGEV